MSIVSNAFFNKNKKNIDFQKLLPELCMDKYIILSHDILKYDEPVCLTFRF